MDVDRRYYNNEHRHGRQRLREHQPAARLPAARPASRRSTSCASGTPTPTSTASRASRSSCARSASRSRTNFSLVQACRASSTRSRTTSRSAEGGRKRAAARRSTSYALFAYGLPSGPLLPGQDRERRARATADSRARPTTSRRRCSSSRTPTSSRRRRRTPRRSARRSSQGAAAVADDGDGPERQRRRRRGGQRAYLLAQRGYQTLLPPNNLKAERAEADCSTSKIYYDPAQKPARRRRRVALAKLMRRPTSRSCRARPSCARSTRLDARRRRSARPSTARSRRRRRSRGAEAPAAERALRRPHGAPTLLEPHVDKVTFRCMVPTVLERSSYPDTHSGDKPVRLYCIDGKHKAVRLVFRTGGEPVLGDPGDRLGRRPASTTAASVTISAAASSTSTTRARACTWSCWREHGATYWVVNTCSTTLSNETMLAIAKGLKPLTAGK